MRILVVLALLALIVIAAGCNVVSASLGLGVLPEFTGSGMFFATKNIAADILLWLVVLTLAVMALAIWRDRRWSEQSALVERLALPENPHVTVVLTAYDDALSIGDAVRDFAGQRHVQEVLVVDNNCRDETAFVAARAGAMVVQEKLQGYGYACMRGLREALRYDPDVVILAEGDGTFAGRDIAKLLSYIDDADMVIGNRVTPGLVDRNSQMDNFFVWGNIVGAKLIRLKFWDWRFLGRTKVSDLGCTMRALRSDALSAMIDDLSVGGMHFSPHMIMAALWRGLLVIEVPVTFWPRVGRSKGASQGLRQGIFIGLSMLWHIARYPTQPTLPAYRPAAPIRAAAKEAA